MKIFFQKVIALLVIMLISYVIGIIFTGNIYILEWSQHARNWYAGVNAVIAILLFLVPDKDYTGNSDEN